ncbi:hypothetical protein [Azospirillum argentinense]|uniref:Uncharacterized protein n=1 Tax=Azospirillum brasilense TaxID=192 RepID=A0A4D8QH46_AZOBR|nr:hypothetical protein [Azospirillum argentinense]QCO07517.1 hypothetical protein D3867_37165 [Azospirillum argentinense]QCO07570.1 hypothetical protein D3867_37435 [Azospirillum argentinense]
MPPKKLNGSELLAELGGTSFDRAPAPAPVPQPSPAPAPRAVGRRSKVGAEFVPLTLRVSAQQHSALSDAAFAVMKARGPGANVTPQDVVRMLIDRAIADPDFPATLIQDDAP